MVFALDDPNDDLVEVEIGEVLAEDGVDQLGQGPGGLDAGGTSPDDGEGERSRSQGRRVDLGRFEAFEDVVSKPCGVGEVVERQRVLGCALDAEVVRRRPCRDHQVVEVERILILDQHLTALVVDADDATTTEPHMALAVEQPAHRMRNVGGVQAGGRHLVEERLKGVEVVLVDDGDSHAVTQSASDGESAEPGSDDDHTGLRHGLSSTL